MKNIFVEEYTSIEELQKDVCLFLSECGFIPLMRDGGVVIRKSPTFTVYLTFDLKHKKYYVKLENTTRNSEWNREYNSLSGAIASIALNGQDEEYNEHLTGLVYKFRTIKRLLKEGFVVTNLAYYCSEQYSYTLTPLIVKHNDKFFTLDLIPSGDHWVRYIVRECTSRTQEQIFQIEGLIKRLRE